MKMKWRDSLLLGCIAAREQASKVGRWAWSAPLALTATQAMATGQAGGVSGMFTNLGTAARNFISLAAIIAVAIGVAAVLYGLVMMIKKGMGRGDDIEWRQIIWPLVGGALASVVMYVVYALVAEVGAQQTNMGQGWTGGAGGGGGAVVTP